MTAGGGRRSRSRSPAVCRCCGDPEGRRRRRATQSRRTASCGCPAADDGEGGDHRSWSDNPPRAPADWRASFQQLRRRWSDEARRRCTRRGSQDRQRPANPSPGEIRALSGRNRPGAQPEYASSGPDPAPWTPEAQCACAPSPQQRLADLQRWREATLRVSVEAVERGSHFSLAACWDPDSAPNARICTGLPTCRTSVIRPAPVVVEPCVSSSSGSSASGSSQSDEVCVTEESDSEEDPLEQVWEEVDEVLEESPIDRDETRAEVESILRASVLSRSEKLAVINAALEESDKSPQERRETAKSMLRRSTRGAREVSDTDDAEREASCVQVRRSSAGGRSLRGSRVRSLVEEFEEGTRESRVSDSRRGSRKSTVSREHRKSTRIEEDGARPSKTARSVRWGSAAVAPVDSRLSSIRASVGGRRLSPPPRKSELHVSAVPASVLERRSTRRSSARRPGSSVLRDEGLATRPSSRTTGNWSVEARNGSRASTYASDESEDDERTSHRHSSGRRSSRVPRESHYRRSTAARSVYDEDDEVLPPRSLSSRKATPWPRHSSNGDAEADEWATPRHSADDSFHTADTSRHSSHRRSSRRSTHREPPEARVSDIEEYSSEEEEERSSVSVLEEGDPAERQRWSSRRRDDEDDDGGAAGGSHLSRHPSSRKSSARRSTYFDAEQSPRKRSSRNGAGERDAHCCSVAGDHASCPSLTRTKRRKRCSCARSERLASASDICCCRRRAAGMGDVSGDSSECCCCHSSSDESCDECSCYCDDVCGSAPELNCVCGDDVAAWKREACWKTTARKGHLEQRKRELGVDLCCECREEEENAQRGGACRQVCPAAVKPCKCALEDWTEPTCLCDRPLSQKKKPKQQISGKRSPAVQQRRSWWRRYLPLAVAVVLWLACVWFLCGMLKPLFFPDYCRARRCCFWTP